MKWLLCINNKDYPASLELMKIYQQLDDKIADKVNMVRIVDESGEDFV